MTRPVISSDMFTTASIVSSIEFDKDRELFAIAGVTKRIKVYDYGVILKDMVDIHYPSNQMLCRSKISCISWNPYHKSTLASSDYDCSVIVWDVATGQVWPLNFTCYFYLSSIHLFAFLQEINDFAEG